MARPFSRTRALSGLLEAYLIGDLAVSRKYGLSTRTIGLWRAKLLDDPEFKAEYDEQRAKLNQAWLENAVDVFREGLECLRRQFTLKPSEITETNCEYITAVTQSLQVMSKIDTNRKVADLKLEGYRRQMDAPQDQPAYLPDLPPNVNQISDGGYVNGQTIDVEPEQ